MFDELQDPDGDDELADRSDADRVVERCEATTGGIREPADRAAALAVQVERDNGFDARVIESARRDRGAGGECKCEEDRQAAHDARLAGRGGVGKRVA